MIQKSGASAFGFLGRLKAAAWRILFEIIFWLTNKIRWRIVKEELER